MDRMWIDVAFTKLLNIYFYKVLLIDGFIKLAIIFIIYHLLFSHVYCLSDSFSISVLNVKDKSPNNKKYRKQDKVSVLDVKTILVQSHCFIIIKLR